MGMTVMIDQAVAPGAGPSKKLRRTVESHSVDCFFVDANTSITALVVDLEMSLDPGSINDVNAHWYQMARHTFTSAELAALQASWVILNTPARRLRANIITATGADGSTDKITVRHRENGEDHSG